MLESLDRNAACTYSVHDGRPLADREVKGMTAAATAECNCTDAIDIAIDITLTTAASYGRWGAWAGSQVWWSCLLTDLSTAHPMCFAAVRYVPPPPQLIGLPWPQVVIEAKPGARVEGGRYPGWGSGIIILGREGRGRNGGKAVGCGAVHYNVL